MKVSDSFQSLVQGVSQQAPHLRRPGQHGEVVNMVPDPVRGLARRHGSRWLAEADIGLDITYSAAAADIAKYRSFDYTSQGIEYTVLYRPTAPEVPNDLPPVLVYNRTSDVWLTTNVVPSAMMTALSSGGVSAITAVGKYVFIAGNTIVPTGSSAAMWADAANAARAAVWVRGGAYSRTFRVQATKTDNTVINFTYMTPAAAYEGTLDISGVPVYAADPAGGTTTEAEALYIRADGSFGKGELNWGAWQPTALTLKNGTTTMTNVSPSNPASASEYRWDAGAATVWVHASLIGNVNITATYTHTKTVTNPHYSNTVNDLTNEYNSKVTQWIASAAAAIQPQAIAEKLRDAAAAAGLSSATVYNSTVVFDNVKALSVQDGGDGSLIRGVANTIGDVDEVTTLHYVGKVVQVQVAEGADPFYLKAVPKVPGTTGWAEVSWVEGAGSEQSIGSAFCYGVASGNTFHVAGSAADLATALPGTHPDFNKSTAGDADTAPLPFFVGRKISYLGVFQDRLLVGSGSVVQLSQTGEYLNFFRTSVLTVTGDDPFSVQATGSEDDEIRHSVLYDQNLILFGRDKQYLISGKAAVSAVSTGITVLSTHAGASDTPPIAAGNLIFYAKRGDTSSSVHQIQPGQVTDSPESYLASSQLDDYLPTNLTEMLAVAKPSVLLIRASGRPNSLFMFHYLDQTNGRVQDAWHRWDFSADLGTLAGMAQRRDSFVLFSLRKANGRMYLVADECSMDAGISRFPYLDSNRPYTQVAAGTGSLRFNTAGDFAVAFDDSSEWRLFGAVLSSASSLQEQYPLATGLRAGARMEAYVIPTNPYVFDTKGKAILTGRLAVTKYLVSYKDSSGFVSEVTTSNGTETQQFNARVTGSVSNIIGRTVIADDTTSVAIGHETREYEIKLKSINWLPLTLDSVEWVGQFFNRIRRL